MNMEVSLCKQEWKDSKCWQLIPLLLTTLCLPRPPLKGNFANFWIIEKLSYPCPEVPFIPRTLTVGLKKSNPLVCVSLWSPWCKVLLVWQLVTTRDSSLQLCGVLALHTGLSTVRGALPSSGLGTNNTPSPQASGHATRGRHHE